MLSLGFVKAEVQLNILVQKQNDSLVESILYRAVRMPIRMFHTRRSNRETTPAKFGVSPLKKIVRRAFDHIAHEL